MSDMISKTAMITTDTAKDWAARVEAFRLALLAGEITREQAKTLCAPYIDKMNDRSREIAKKYNQRPRLFSFAGLMR